MFCHTTRSRAHPGDLEPAAHSTASSEDRQLGDMSRPRAVLGRPAGRLPQVSWIIPNGIDSEHPTSESAHRHAVRDRADQHDHAQPGLEEHRHLPRLGRLGRLLRPRRPPVVDGPATVFASRVSSSAPTPAADTSTISSSASMPSLKFIEDDFLHGPRLDPKNDGRPDPRPDVRENVALLGDLQRTSTSANARGAGADPRLVNESRRRRGPLAQSMAGRRRRRHPGAGLPPRRPGFGSRPTRSWSCPPGGTPSPAR